MVGQGAVSSKLRDAGGSTKTNLLHCDEEIRYEEGIGGERNGRGVRVPSRGGECAKASVIVGSYPVVPDLSELKVP